MYNTEKARRDMNKFLERIDGAPVSTLLQEIQETLDGDHDSLYESRNYLAQGNLSFTITREGILDFYKIPGMWLDIISKCLEETEGNADSDKIMSATFAPTYFRGYGRDVVYICEINLGDPTEGYIKRSYRHPNIYEKIMTQDQVRAIFNATLASGYNILDFYDEPLNIISDWRRGKSARNVAPLS